MLQVTVLCSLGSSALRAAPCQLLGLGVARVLCLGGNEARGSKGSISPPPHPGDALGQQPAQVQGLGLDLPDGNSGLVQTPGLWLDPTSSPSLLLLSPKSPFHFRFTLGLPPLCL